MKKSIFTLAAARPSIGTIFFSGVMLLQLSLPVASEAEAVKVYVRNTSEHSEKERAKRRAYFLQKCLSSEYNAQCADFFEKEFNPKRSKEYCLQHPDEDACAERLRAMEQEESMKRSIAKHRELAAFCKAEPNALRCKKRREQAE